MGKTEFTLYEFRYGKMMGYHKQGKWAISS